MPDKENENKLMAMLERRGIVRKTGSEDDQPASDSALSKDSLRPETDISALLAATTNETVKVTPASRQPVPGMSTSILSGELQQNTSREQPQQLDSIVVELSDIMESSQTEESEITEKQETEESVLSEQPHEEDRPITEDESPITSEEPIEEEQSSSEPEDTADTAIPLNFPGGFEVFSCDTTHSEPITTTEETSPPVPQPVSSPDDYTNRFIDIDDLYEVLALKSNRTETIYLIEEYLKSLPDSLPDESRRDIVEKIVTASGFDYDLLMGDGVLRVKMLKDYAERFANRTDDYIASRQAELEELDQQILRVRKLIENRRELHKKQFFAIEKEAQRLKEILEFLSG